MGGWHCVPHPERLIANQEFLEKSCFKNWKILGRCEASWGEPERDMTISTRLSDSVLTETHGLENALKSEYE